MCRNHSVQVIGVGLAAHEDDWCAVLGCCHGGIRSEVGLADGGAGRGAHALGEQGLCAVVGEVGEHQLRQLVPGHPLQRLVLTDEAGVEHVDGDPEGRSRSALADAGLEHEELAVLDGELDVAHVAVVRLELLHDRDQVVVALLVDALHVGQRQRVADAGDDVLALGVLEVVAVDPNRSGRGVTGEGDTGAGVHAAVAEDHDLHVDRRAEVGGDALATAIEHGAIGVPRVEDGLDRTHELGLGVLGELAAVVLEDDRLVGLDELPQVVGVQLEVSGDALGLLDRVHRVLEALTLEVEHGLAVHLEQPAV